MSDLMNDHARLCEGREYTCTCGYDAQQASYLASVVEERDRLREALRECEEYFDNRADADCDQDGFIPNKEMVMLTTVRSALEGK